MSNTNLTFNSFLFYKEEGDNDLIAALLKGLELTPPYQVIDINKSLIDWSSLGYESKELFFVDLPQELEIYWHIKCHITQVNCAVAVGKFPLLFDKRNPLGYLSSLCKRYNLPLYIIRTNDDGNY